MNLLQDATFHQNWLARRGFAFFRCADARPLLGMQADPRAPARLYALPFVVRLAAIEMLLLLALRVVVCSSAAPPWRDL